MKILRNIFQEISNQVTLVIFRQFSFVLRQDSLHWKEVYYGEKVTSEFLHTSRASGFLILTPGRGLRIGLGQARREVPRWPGQRCGDER